MPLSEERGYEEHQKAVVTLHPGEQTVYVNHRNSTLSVKAPIQGDERWFCRPESHCRLSLRKGQDDWFDITVDRPVMDLFFQLVSPQRSDFAWHMVTFKRLSHE